MFNYDSQYDNTTCATQNWILDIIKANAQSSSWTLNPNYNSVSSFVTSVRIMFSGGVDEESYVANTGTIVPSVYLKSSVKITGGYGTSDDPYTLEL